MRGHISFSELKIWNECAYKHKLKYIDKVDEFKGNEFTAFGTAVHDTCEKAMLTGTLEEQNYFVLSFLREIEKLKDIGVNLDTKLLVEMKDQGKDMSNLLMPALKEYFGSYEIFSTEEKLYEDIEESPLKFKGYIDLVVKTGDGKYHIIDYKTCSWGWNARKKNDKILTYQLTLYKIFFSKKHNIDLKDIETHFILLKRTAKKDRVEPFRVTSGKKKVQNALNLLDKSIYNITSKRYIKNRTSCNLCEFNKTKYCN